MRLVASQGEVQLGDTPLSQLPRRAAPPAPSSADGVQTPRCPFTADAVFDIVSEGLRFHYPAYRCGSGERYPHLVKSAYRKARRPYLRAFRRTAPTHCRSRAIILEPELLVLDEPTSALDRTVQKQLVVLLRELQARASLAICLSAMTLPWYGRWPIGSWC